MCYVSPQQWSTHTLSFGKLLKTYILFHDGITGIYLSQDLKPAVNVFERLLGNQVLMLDNFTKTFYNCISFHDEI